MYKLILEKLKDKSIAILGFGREGKSTYNSSPHYTIVSLYSCCVTHC